MVYFFQDFMLDDERRELLRDGEEVSVQPLVFDLLLYLLRNRDRVVTKQELLESLWPDATVAEGSLTRAISLARTALKTPGGEDPIRTYARQGYRFIAGVRTDQEGEESAGADIAETPPTHEETRPGLLAALHACEKGDWDQAIELFEMADRELSLPAHELEQWGFAARCAGKGAVALPPLERAVTAYSKGGRRSDAARVALMLALIQLERRESAVARGWLRRAERFLEGEPERPEHGHLAWLCSKFAAEEGEHEESLRYAEAAYDLGRRLDDADLEALGLLQRGAALLALGQTKEGAALHDEAAVIVLSERVSPLWGGAVYCGVLFGCRYGADWQRASQWSMQFQQWRDRQGLDHFTGSCRLHHAEVLGMRGELAEAEALAEEAALFLTESAPWAVGEAMRVLGDLRLSRGEFDGAEAAYLRAHELGWTTQPGFAVLKVHRGQPDFALRDMERTLEDPGWPSRQRRGILLAHLVRIAVAAGELDRARTALIELEDRPELWSSPALEAEVLRARAEVDLAEKDAEAAVTSLRRALSLWREIDAPASLAATRFRLAEVLASLEEVEAAALEIAAAEALYRRIGAGPFVDRCVEWKAAQEKAAG